MPLHYILTGLIAALIALVGCWLTDDTFAGVAMGAGAVGVAVVLWDLQRYPHRPYNTDHGRSNMSYYTARRDSKTAQLLVHFSEYPDDTLTGDQAADLMDCKPSRVRSTCQALRKRGLVIVSVADHGMQLHLGEKVRIDVDEDTVAAWIVGTELDEDESMPRVQRTISAADAPRLAVCAPRSVFELGGRAHG